MNKSLIAKRFSKAINTYPHEASIQQQIARKMIELAGQYIQTSHPQVIEFGCGTGIYSRMLARHFHPRHLWLNDLCHEMKTCCKDLLSEQASFLPGDAETIPFPQNSELITSCSALQWFESPKKFFCKCHSLLSANGYLAFSTFGKENLKEIRRLTDRGLSYRSLKELENALSPYFRILHSEEEIIPLSFETPMNVLYHLKQTGVTGVNNNASDAESLHSWTRRDLSRFCEQYLQHFSKNNSVILTYHPIYIIAKKKEA